MTAAGKTGAPLPAYVSWPTFENCLAWLSDMVVLPTQLDRSVWESKFSGSTGRQLMLALQWLGLLDGDHRPTQALEELTAATNIEEQKQRLRDIFRAVYGAELVDDIARMTPQMVDDKIKALGTSASTQRKAFSFFVNAAKFMDLPIPPTIAKRARNRPAGKRTAAPTKQQKAETVQQTTEPPASPSEPESTVPAIQDTYNLHALVLDLMKDLERFGPTWTEPKRKSWQATFAQILDYAYPAKPGEAPNDAHTDR